MIIKHSESTKALTVVSLEHKDGVAIRQDMTVTIDCSKYTRRTRGQQKRETRQTHTQNTNTGQIIVVGDLNAKDAVWGSPMNDARGEGIYEWVLVNKFTIHNAHDKPSAFSCARGRSWVDLTMPRSLNITD